MFEKESMTARTPAQDGDKDRNFSNSDRKIRTDQELSMLSHTRVLLGPCCNKFSENTRDVKSKLDPTYEDYPSYLSDSF